MIDFRKTIQMHRDDFRKTVAMPRPVKEPYNCPITDQELHELVRLAKKCSAWPWDVDHKPTSDDLQFASVARGAIPRLVNELRKLRSFNGG